MNQPVAYANHLQPGQIRILFLDGCGYAIRSFANDFHQTGQSKVEQAVGVQIGAFSPMANFDRLTGM